MTEQAWNKKYQP